MKIGILQAGHVAQSLIQKHGDFADMFAQLLSDSGYEFDVWNVVDGKFPNTPNCSDGWLITGSKFSVYDDFDWIKKLEEFSRFCLDESIPMVGVCFGHQLLAKALGGEVKQASQGWGVGVHRYESELGKLCLPAWHQDQVLKPPECAQIIGSSSFCPIAILKYGDRALSFQPHPEFNDDFLLDMINLRASDAIPNERLQDARTSMNEISQMDESKAHVAKHFTQFFTKKQSSL